MAAALDQMIKDGVDVKEASLEFDFGGKETTKPWPPGQKLMDYIKKVSEIEKLTHTAKPPMALSKYVLSDFFPLELMKLH